MSYAERPTDRQRQKEVMDDMIDLFDSLPSIQAKREILAFLAASAGMELKGSYSPPRRGNYRPSPKGNSG